MFAVDQRVETYKFSFMKGHTSIDDLSPEHFF